MKCKHKDGRQADRQPMRTNWIFDEELGWVNVDRFLSKVKRIEKEINRKMRKTG